MDERTTYEVLLVGGSPSPSEARLMASLARSAAAIVAVDRGLDWCLRADVMPTLFCGDADTVSPSALRQARDAGVRGDLHPREKDETDLELAFRLAQELAAGHELRVTLSCVSGGRPDHGLAVFGVLARHADCWPRMVEDGFECRVLSPQGRTSWELADDACGQVFSSIALAPDSELSLEGFAWDYERTTLGLLDDRGVSNVVRAPHARVSCLAGCVAAFLFDDGAASADADARPPISAVPATDKSS